MVGSSAMLLAPARFHGCAVNLGNLGRPEEPVCTTTGLNPLCPPGFADPQFSVCWREHRSGGGTM